MLHARGGDRMCMCVVQACRTDWSATDGNQAERTNYELSDICSSFCFMLRSQSQHTAQPGTVLSEIRVVDEESEAHVKHSPLGGSSKTKY